MPSDLPGAELLTDGRNLFKGASTLPSVDISCNVAGATPAAETPRMPNPVVKILAAEAWLLSPGESRVSESPDVRLDTAVKRLPDSTGTKELGGGRLLREWSMGSGGMGDIDEAEVIRESEGYSGSGDRMNRKGGYVISETTLATTLAASSCCCVLDVCSLRFVECVALFSSEVPSEEDNSDVMKDVDSKRSSEASTTMLEAPSCQSYGESVLKEDGDGWGEMTLR